MPSLSPLSRIIWHNWWLDFLYMNDKFLLQNSCWNMNSPWKQSTSPSFSTPQWNHSTIFTTNYWQWFFSFKQYPLIEYEHFSIFALTFPLPSNKFPIYFYQKLCLNLQLLILTWIFFKADPYIHHSYISFLIQCLLFLGVNYLIFIESIYFPFFF